MYPKLSPLSLRGDVGDIGVMICIVQCAISFEHVYVFIEFVRSNMLSMIWHTGVYYCKAIYVRVHHSFENTQNSFRKYFFIPFSTLNTVLMYNSFHIICRIRYLSLLHIFGVGEIYSIFSSIGDNSHKEKNKLRAIRR